LVALPLFRWAYLILLLVFVGLLISFKTIRKNNADLVKVKHKKASKMAQKRMKIAHSMLKQEHNEKFYEEVLNSLWGYLSNKLNLPSSQHKRDTVKEILKDKNIQEILITEMNDLLDMCEFARYAPSAVKESNQAIYDRSVELISKLDDAIKK
jgi:predicted solute-binding protein